MMIGKFICIAVASLMLMISVGSQAVEDERAGRPFNVQKLKNVGLRVFTPLSPTWEQEFDKQETTDAILLSTPSNYYPPARMSIKLHPEYQVTQEELLEAAHTALNASRKQANKPALSKKSNLEYAEYGVVKGYVDHYTIKENGKLWSMKTLFGIMPSQQPVVLMVATPKGQLDHIEHMVIKIWKNLRVLPAYLPSNK